LERFRKPFLAFLAFGFAILNQLAGAAFGLAIPSPLSPSRGLCLDFFSPLHIPVAIIEFSAHERGCRFLLPLPQKEDFRTVERRGKTVEISSDQQMRNWGQPASAAG
jgi:hypothetical protein